jgi:colanic acid/amylovoran biosynthesis protein
MKTAAIINSVPANTGDELLLNVAMRILKSSNFNTSSVHSNQPEIANQVVPEYCHFWDLNEARTRDVQPFIRRPVGGILQRMGVRAMWPLALAGLGKRTAPAWQALNEAEWVFSSAGGYLNSRYGYHDRLLCFEDLLAAGKRLVFLPQSIGPFDTKKDHTRLMKTLERVQLVMTRDAISVEYLAEIGYDEPNVTIWPDLGLLSGTFGHSSRRKTNQDETPRKILFNAREWVYKENSESLASRLSKILQYLVSDGQTEVICASTCQGVPNYVDDSKFMTSIRSHLDAKSQTFVKITSNHLRPQEYFDLAKTCDAYVGMRLHGAIISMHAGIPALAIGYEDKSLEIFTELGLRDNCVDMMSSTEELLFRVDRMLNNSEIYESVLRRALASPKYCHRNFSKRFDHLLNIPGNGRDIVL